METVHRAGVVPIVLGSDPWIKSERYQVPVLVPVWPAGYVSCGRCGTVGVLAKLA